MISILRKHPAVPDDVVNSPLSNYHYRESVSLISELESRLPRSGPVFKNDNTMVWMKIEEDYCGVSVDLSVKYFPFTKMDVVLFKL